MSKVLPILFNTDMVRAILDGRKTVTRRICKDGDVYSVPDMGFYDSSRRTYGVHNYTDLEHEYTNKVCTVERPCPICPGDILYVREKWRCWRAHRYDANVDIGFAAGGEGVRIYFANGGTDSVNRNDYDTFVNKWFDGERYHPAIHMPKEAARIWLKVKDVRVERLQDIDDEGAKAEGANWKNGKNVGFEEKMRRSAVERFAEIWDSTISKGQQALYGWAANPWVWVIEFERCGKPESEGLKNGM